MRDKIIWRLKIAGKFRKNEGHLGCKRRKQRHMVNWNQDKKLLLHSYLAQTLSVCISFELVSTLPGNAGDYAEMI